MKNVTTSFQRALKGILAGGICCIAAVAWAQGESASSSDLASFINPGSSGAHVDKATGGFSFSLPLMTIPGAAGEGYPVMLAYSPPMPSASASWVGHGWTLGPGAITRSQNGIPDDFNAVDIINIDKRPAYERLTLSAVVGPEALSAISLDVTPTIVLDNQRGVLPSVGLSLSGYGAGISYTQQKGEGVFSFSVHPMAAVNGLKSAANNSPSNPDTGGDVAPAANGAGETRRDQIRSWPRRALKGLMSEDFNRSSSWSPQTFAIPAMNNGIHESRYFGEFSLEYAAFTNIGLEGGIRASLDRVEYDKFDAVTSYGFMHSGEVNLNSDDETMEAMDYFEERAHTLDEYDRFIPIPIQTPDVFQVSAGNLGGQFRCYFSGPGSLHPRGIEFHSEAEFDFGTELGAGGGFPNLFNGVIGATPSLDLFSDLTQRSWLAEDNGVTFSGFSTSRNRRFFAFKGDPGLRRNLLDDGLVTRAVPAGDWRNLDGATYFFDDATRHRTLELSRSVEDRVDFNWRPRLNKTIRWNTADDMTVTSYGGVAYRQFDKTNYDAAGFIDYGSVAEESITEFEVVDEAGMRYTFGLPVYTRNQLNLSFSVDPNASGNQVVDDKVIFCDGPDIGKLLTGDDEDMASALSGIDIANGKLNKEPVATMWLLTSITSPDYVDLTDDGCTDDDYGTWVRFEYEQLFGTANKLDETTPWFRYRDPVAGNHYSEGSLGDDRDDMASFSLGEKEVYVLRRIETRTHFAEFSTANRNDGRTISNFNKASSKTDGSQWGSDELQRLLSMELRAKDQSGGTSYKLLQTVNFNTSYTSWPADYAQGGLSDPSLGRGKLTLDDVTIKSFGVDEDAKTTAFDYTYFDKTAIQEANLLAKYESLFDEYGGLDEQPDFTYGCSDAWGFNKDWTTDYWSRYHNWRRIDAGYLGNSDPAAWCLKQITMPTGLRILPQYERNEYRYVQDKPAHVMVPLSGTIASSSNRIYLDEDYLTNTLSASGPGSGLGWEGTPSELATMLHDQLAGKRIFTKILFYMVGANGGTPSANDGWNYFPTFVKVDHVGYDSGLYIQFSETGNYSLPQQACWDFCQKNPRVSVEGAIPQPFSESQSQLLTQITEAIESAAEVAVSLSNATSVACIDFDPALSYVRIPLLNGASKTGGGLRIKRLMVFDPGIETADGPEGELLTGTEYHYDSWDDNLGKWVSSGVAANEPKSIYEECTLYRPLAKEGQSLAKRLLGGKDTETQAGPVGESFLPPPGVAYEEVTTRSIHDDVSGEGETVHRFFSHRTHPVQIDWTDPSKSQIDIQKPNPINSLIDIVVLKGLWYSQGIRVQTTDMAGKPRETISYSAERDREGIRVPVSRTSYDYFDPGADIPTLDGWETGAKRFGSFDEVYFMGKFLRNKKNTLKVELDFDLSLFFPAVLLPVPSGWPTGSIMTEVQGTHASVMQSHRPAQIRSITSERSGMETIVENIYYDRATAKPVLTATTDGFSDVRFDADGAATAAQTEAFTSRKLDLTASALPWHKEFGKASKNDQLELVPAQGLMSAVDDVTLSYEIHTHGSDYQDVIFLEFCPRPGEDLCGILGDGGLFFPGDMLEIDGYASGVPKKSINYVREVDGNRVYLDYSTKLGSWNGMAVNKIRILKSGRSNQLSTSMGNIVAYDEELDITVTPRPVANTFRNNLVNTLNAAIPTIPASGSASTTTTNLSLGAWSNTAIEEAGCLEMGDPSVGLNAFHMEFRGNGGQYVCGTGFISFPDPPNVSIFTPSTGGSGGGGGGGGGGGSTGGGDDGTGDPSPNGRVINVAGHITIPIHYAPASEGGPGEFQFDEELGAIVWVSPDAPCSPTVVFTACEDFSQEVRIANVMSASAASFSDEISKPYTPVHPFNAGYEFGTRGRWSPESQFSYSSVATSFLDGTTTHSTQVGMMEDFTMLSPYHTDYADDRWINVSTTEELDAAGRTIETSDVYGYRHAQRFNYVENRPIWSADGGSQDNCAFESFENRTAGSSFTLTDSGTESALIRGNRVDDVAHSGSHSWRFGVGFANQCVRMIMPRIRIDKKTHQQGIRVRFWAHEPVFNKTKKYSMDNMFTVGLHQGNITNTTCSSPTTMTLEVEADSIAQTGQWVLIDAVFTEDDLDNAGIPIGAKVSPVIQCDRSGSGSINKNIYIDDVRVQPTQASMSCAVFDPLDFRLLTEFDGNHFGTFQQYNHKGEPIRQVVETESGMKTVSETQSHTLEN